MRRIRLGGKNYPGLYTKIDDADYDLVSQYSWYPHKAGTKVVPHFVAEARVNGKYISLHRLLMKAKKGQLVDHINRDPLDNRRANLRFATRAQNRANSVLGWGASKHPGVTKHSRSGKWLACFYFEGRLRRVGLFESERTAYIAVRKASLEKLGTFSPYYKKVK